MQAQRNAVGPRTEFESGMPALAGSPQSTVNAQRRQAEWAAALRVDPEVTNSVDMLTLIPACPFYDEGQRMYRVALHKPFGEVFTAYMP